MSVVSCRFYPVSYVRLFLLLISFIFLGRFPAGRAFALAFFLLRKLHKKKSSDNCSIPNAVYPILRARVFHLAAKRSCVFLLYIRNLPLMELLCCTMFITSAKSGAQLTTLIFLDSFFNGMESVTINSNNLEFSIFS